MTDINEILEMKRAYLQRIQKDGRAEILRLALEAMEKDGVEKIQWTQYTPHFNDGDPCYFSVNKVHALDAEDLELLEAEYKLCDGEWKRIETGISLKNIQAFSAVLNELEDMMEVVFGDGYQITITRDGTIDVEECDHD